MDDADVMFQFSELGKVDAGGGGTIAHLMAEYGMHAPFEVVSKADVYETVRGYRAFLRA